MFVEVLTRAKREPEPAVAHDLNGRRGLSNDRRMVANHGTCNEGRKLHAARAVGDRAQHAPRERTIGVAAQPRMKVIRDDGEVEADTLRLLCLVHELLWTVDLAEERVTELRHR